MNTAKYEFNITDLSQWIVIGAGGEVAGHDANHALCMCAMTMYFSLKRGKLGVCNIAFAILVKAESLSACLWLQLFHWNIIAL